MIQLAVQIEVSFVSPLRRSKWNQRHSGRFQVSLDFSMASNQAARGIADIARREKNIVAKIVRNYAMIS